MIPLTRAEDMSPFELDHTFPGTLYAGDGARLAGAGPCTFTPEMNAGLPFKALVCGSAPTPNDDVLTLEDRLWVLPERFSTPDVLPMPLLYQLASLVRAGRKVGLASADQPVCDQARDMLMLMLVLAAPGGEA